ncbi:MAG: thiamine pyrophosphate-dependent enzyme, partial [Bacteroidota bacterium]
MNFERRNLSDAELLALYKQLRFPRMIEEKMLVLLRQGRISKWFSGIGQEAISVGVSTALESTDYLLPLHRNLGVFTTRHLYCSDVGVERPYPLFSITKITGKSHTAA